MTSAAPNPVALIFGASGQDAWYLAQHCAAAGIQPVSVSRSAGGAWLVGDVSRRDQVEALVAAHRPAYIFHLAANSTTRHFFIF